MGYTVQIDENEAIRMFFGNSLPLEESWPGSQAHDFLSAICRLSFEDILQIIDGFRYDEPLDTNYVPQFADMEAVDNTAYIISKSGQDVLNYGELGYFLIRDPKKLAAYRKYGENHGKGASLLGLAVFHRGEFKKSCLTDAFADLPTNEERAAIRNRLFLRIPFIQNALFLAKDNRFNAYDLIRMFTEKTMTRRAQSPRKIFKELQSCGCPELNRRINNIYWTV